MLRNWNTSETPSFEQCRNNAFTSYFSLLHLLTILQLLQDSLFSIQQIQIFADPTYSHGVSADACQKLTVQCDISSQVRHQHSASDPSEIITVLAS